MPSKGSSQQGPREVRAAGDTVPSAPDSSESAASQPQGQGVAHPRTNPTNPKPTPTTLEACLAAVARGHGYLAMSNTYVYVFPVLPRSVRSCFIARYPCRLATAGEARLRHGVGFGFVGFVRGWATPCPCGCDAADWDESGADGTVSPAARTSRGPCWDEPFEGMVDSSL